MHNNQLELLKDEALAFAKLLLAKHGEYFPFGYVLLTNDEVQLIQPSDGTEHPESKVLIDILQDGMEESARRGEIQACAICWDCLVALKSSPDEKLDAVAIHLEHANGEAVVSFNPYKKRFLRAPQYLEPFTDTTSSMVFAP